MYEFNVNRLCVCHVNYIMELISYYRIYVSIFLRFASPCCNYLCCIKNEISREETKKKKLIDWRIINMNANFEERKKKIATL
jgi:hypothetical protein